MRASAFNPTFVSMQGRVHGLVLGSELVIAAGVVGLVSLLFNWLIGLLVSGFVLMGLMMLRRKSEGRTDYLRTLYRSIARPKGRYAPAMMDRRPRRTS